MIVDHHDDGNKDIPNNNYVTEMRMMLLMMIIKMEIRMMTMRKMMAATIGMITMLAGFLSGVHVFTLSQMERDRRRGRTPAGRGTLAPPPATTRARTPATVGRTMLQ